LSTRAAFAVGIVAIVALALAAGLVGLQRLPSRPPAQAAARSRPATTASPAPPPAVATSPSQVPTEYGHVVVIVLENHSFSSVIGSSQAPYLNGLAGQWSLATGYSGVSHPSLPNYLALVGGDTFGVTSDCTDCFVSAPSLPDRLEAAGRTWKAYMEGMPEPCFVGSSGLYAQKHDPFVYFDDIRTEAARCDRIVPYSSLAGDFSSAATAPDFAFISPNLCNDGHDCALSVTDAWLGREVPALLASSAFSGSPSLLVITFDEGEGGEDRVATVLVGSGVKRGYRSATAYDHYSLLRTVETLWQLPPLAAGDTGASPMTEFLGAPR
jgi:phosphatidylinositol-3-phosphatase